jgi:hypothetical protein
MKLFYTAIILFFFINTTKAQTKLINLCEDCMNNSDFEFYFNGVADSSLLYINIDTSQVNNIWQIGSVSKTIFTYGYFGPRALVTDTVNPYPVNNVSSFEYTFINCNDTSLISCGGNYYGATIDMYQRMESEIGKDGGTIEVSHDNGQTWLNLIQDTISFPYFYNGPPYSMNDTVSSLGKPGTSGSRNWSHITVDYLPVNISNMNDTITFRFTFASDSVQTDQDGWMFGYIKVFAAFPGIQEIRNDKFISVFPNPAKDEILIQHEITSDKVRCRIIDFRGNLIMENLNMQNDKIDTRVLDNGLYMLQYSAGRITANKKFIVQH